jgi:hypothetical protein
MTGIATDVGNILGHALRKGTKAELWRLKVHVPLLVGFIVGGALGQAAWMGMRYTSMLLPSMFTGAVTFLRAD